MTCAMRLSGATAPNTLNSTTYPQVWNWAQASSTNQSALTIGESSAASGSGLIELNVQTNSSSTALPIQITAGGTTAGWNMSTAGLWKPIGAGALALGGSAHGLAISEGSLTALNLLVHCRAFRFRLRAVVIPSCILIVIATSRKAAEPLLR